MAWREFRLHVLLLARTLGALPLMILATWVVVAAVQEPLFFRTQGIPLFWSSVFAIVDLFAVAAVATWLDQVRALARDDTLCLLARLAPAALAMTGALAAAALGLLADTVRGAPWELAAAVGPLRALLVWTPVSLTAASVRAVPTPLHWLGTGAATLVMLGILPVSSVERLPSADTLLAATIAVAGGLVAAAPRR